MFKIYHFESESRKLGLIVEKNKIWDDLNQDDKTMTMNLRSAMKAFGDATLSPLQLSHILQDCTEFFFVVVIINLNWFRIQFTDPVAHETMCRYQRHDRRGKHAFVFKQSDEY